MLLAERLGHDRAVILHVDDIGLCQGANRAYLELFARGLVTSGSVMVPCPAFREIAEAAAADPTLDLGVHLTLTSEWPGHRWGPVSTRSPASGLIDADGCFWRDVRSLQAHLVPEAAETELRAQIERALAAGLRPTHIDAHMAAAMLPELLDVHLRLALDYELVPVLPRAIRFAPDPEGHGSRARDLLRRCGIRFAGDTDAYGSAIAWLDAAGLPVVEHFRGTLAVAAERVEAGYRAVVEGLPAGVTHFALHATVPGEIEAISPEHAPWRSNEYALFASGAVSAWCAAEGVVPIGYREIQRLWRSVMTARAVPDQASAGSAGK